MTNPETGDQVEIPRPEILDGMSVLEPEFNSGDLDDDLTQRLVRRVDETAAYARGLWDVLSGVVLYLREDVARGRSAGTAIRTDEEWDRWQHTYTAALSALAGPAGDSGFAAEQSLLERQNHNSPAR